MSHDASTAYYFAYGSNLCPQQMESRCPGARAAGAARLAGYRLTFSVASQRWGAGAAGVEPDEDGYVEGVLYELTEEHLAMLDRYEGNYTRGAARVRCPQRGEIEVVIYRPKRDDGAMRPSAEYLATMVRGARAHGLSEGWIEYLGSVHT